MTWKFFGKLEACVNVQMTKTSHVIVNMNFMDKIKIPSLSLSTPNIFSFFSLQNTVNNFTVMAVLLS